MIEIAIYGKGGIGKSTVSSNLSAALSFENKKIIQIGCDPKHDSTRLLTNGIAIPTILDYIKETKTVDYRLNDVLCHGYRNIACVEAGGPKPGVGCAGRGIITAFEFLYIFKVKESYDIAVYDVLGDVVCGGFAVPIRSEYADMIFLVTSGEYMSIYAANNILRGIENYDKDNVKRVAGIIYNARNLNDEDERVENFAKAVGLPVVAKIPRSDEFAKAERKNQTVIQCGNGNLSRIFKNLSKYILGDPQLYSPLPLTDDELEETIFGCNAAKHYNAGNTKQIDNPKYYGEINQSNGGEINTDNLFLSKNVVYDEPLHGCAFNGALSMTAQINDIRVIAHGPAHCTFLSYQTISSAGRRALFERGAVLPVPLMPNVTATDMNHEDMVFGGMDKLNDAVKYALEKNPPAIVVISTCPAGIIGDNVDKTKELSADNIPILTLKADGNIAGDFLQGMLMAYTRLALQAIDVNAKRKSNLVNIVFEKVIAKNTETNYEIIREYLDALGLEVNCRFLCNTSYDKLKNFMAAPLNLLAFNDYTGKILRDFFEREFQAKFFNMEFPVGMSNTSLWLKNLAEIYGKEEIVESIIKNSEIEYLRRIDYVREILKGKRLMIITYNHSLDWILESVIASNMVIVKIGILNFSQDDKFITAIDRESLNVEIDYDRDKRDDDIKRLKPDIVLSNYNGNVGEGILVDTIPMCPNVGFFSGVEILERWAKLLDMNIAGNWKDDKALFN